jgi:nitrogen metabolism transcriptional regulator, NtrC, Fis family
MKANHAKINVHEGLAEIVHNKLSSYFEALNGDQPALGLYDQIIKEVEKPLIQVVLEKVSGNKVKAAHILGINRNTLAKKIKDLGII